MKWVLWLILLNISTSEAVAEGRCVLVVHCWGGIDRGGGWEKRSNRNGLTFKCKVVNLINIGIFPVNWRLAGCH